MASKFNEKLHEWCMNRNMSRNDLIAKLQLFNYDEFKGLDSITLSRWFTGKTIPSLYKQCLIAKYLGYGLVDFILSIESSSLKSSSKLLKVITDFLTTLDHGIQALSYKEESNKFTSTIEFDTYDEHIKKFGAFYRNIDTISDYINELYSLENKVDYTSFTLRNRHGDILSHWTGIENLNSINGMSSFISIPENQLAKSSLLKIAYFQNSSQYFELIINAACYYLLNDTVDKEFIYIYIYGNMIFKFTKNVFEAETMRIYRSSKVNSPDVYLVKVNIIKSLANPILFPLIKDRLQYLGFNDYNIHQNIM